MRRWLRRLVIGLAVVLVVIVATGSVTYVVAGRRFARHVDVAVHDTVRVPTDSASIARGQHLATAVTNCAMCHGENLGGMKFIDAGPLIGTVYTPNLTSGRGGIGGRFTGADWARAIRHGVDPTGRPLKIMPAEDFQYLSDADLADIVAYIRSRPPVDHVTQASRVGPLARVLYLAGKFPIIPAEEVHHDLVQPRQVTPGVTREYGEYLTKIAGCQGCHRADLAGGPIGAAPPGTPPAQNLTPAGIGSWTEQDLARALRTGRRPDGSAINGFMPWTTFRNMTDDEIAAIWKYLSTLPARPMHG